MKASEATGVTNPMQNLLSLLRAKRWGRNGWIALNVLAVGGGLYLNWGWLAAAGLAPLKTLWTPEQRRLQREESKKAPFPPEKEWRAR